MIARFLQNLTSYNSKLILKEEATGFPDIIEEKFQKIFKSWAGGVTAAQFISNLTVDALKQELSHTNNLSTTDLNRWLTLHPSTYDLDVTIEPITPKEHKNTIIHFGFAKSTFGECFIASTEKGICSLKFIDEDNLAVSAFQNEWKHATLVRDDAMAEKINKDIFSSQGTTKLTLHVKGTPFQIGVWQALASIPFGSVISYRGVAKLIGNDKAVRAVASAIAQNPVGYITPCHRVIRNNGAIGEFRWDRDRKALIIGWEKAMVDKKTTANL